MVQRGVFAWHIACCVCNVSRSGCILFEDAYTSFNASDYTQDAGTWGVDGGALAVEDSNARIRFNQFDGDKSGKLYSTIQGSDDGDQLRHIVGYLNSDYYLYSQVELTSAGCDGILSLHKVDDGNDTELVSKRVTYANPSGEHILMTCYDSDTSEFRSTFYGSGIHIFLYGGAPFEDTLIHTETEVYGTYAGFATGSIGTKAYFDDALFTKLDSQDQDIRCSNCDPSGLGCTVYGINPITELDECIWDVTGSPIFNGGVHGTFTAVCKYPVRLSTAPDAYVQSSFFLSPAVSGVSDKIRLFTDAIDADNYHYVDIWANSPEGIYASGLNVQFGKRSGGADVVLGDDWTIFKVEQNQVPGGSLLLCASDYTINAYCGGSSAVRNTTLHDGYYSGIEGFGDSRITTFVLKERHLWLPYGVQCPSCLSCAPCQDEVLHDYKLVIAGVTNAYCDSCDNMNGTYILEWDDFQNAIQYPNTCVFSNNTQKEICDPYGDTESALYLYFTNASPPRITIRPQNDSLNHFQLNTDFFELDCATFVDVDIPTIGDIESCNYSNATATLSIV